MGFLRDVPQGVVYELVVLARMGSLSSAYVVGQPRGARVRGGGVRTRADVRHGTERRRGPEDCRAGRGRTAGSGVLGLLSGRRGTAGPTSVSGLDPHARAVLCRMGPRDPAVPAS